MSNLNSTNPNSDLAGWLGQKFPNPLKNEKPLPELKEGVPFDCQGNQLSFPDYIDCKYWKENCVWHDKMFIEEIQRGRSAAQLNLRSFLTNTTYSMFILDLCIMSQTKTIDKGIVEGEWTIVRRGANYGLKLADSSKVNGDCPLDYHVEDLNPLIDKSWEDELKLVNIQRGRSAANFIFQSSRSGLYYLMFMIDTCITMQDSIINNGVLSGNWEVVKRGQSLGIHLCNSSSKPRKLMLSKVKK